MHGQEIAPFRFVGYEGYANVRFMRDDLTTIQPGANGGQSTRSRQGIIDMREEIFLLTHSYVYHPNFLLIDAGGGPVLQQNAVAGDSGSARARNNLYNLTGRATFLRDKPVRGAVFYEHLNPTVSLAPGLAMTQENERYGLNFALLSPLTPVPLQVDATHTHNAGRGADRIVDDRTDRVDARATVGWGKLGSTQVSMQAMKQDSASGSTGLPIQNSSSTAQSVNLDTRLQFGANRQYDLTSLLAANTQRFAFSQGSLPTRNDVRLVFDFRGRSAESLATFASWSHTEVEQGDLSTVANAMAGGFTWRVNPELSLSAGARADDNTTRQFNTRSQGIDGSVAYQRALPLGTLQVNYAARVDVREQQALAGSVGVLGERLTLTGTTFSNLSRPLVVVPTIVVSNITRTQVYTAGADYVVTVLGNITRIQRQVAGLILDGQEVLVDFNYDVGGTYAYRQTDQTLGINWRVNQYVSTYFRHFESVPSLTSGAPTSPLNQVMSRVYGARADVPLGFSLGTAVGGSVEYEDRVETISPYQRASYDIYAQAEDPFFGIGNLRAGMRKTRQEYPNAIQNVDLTGYDLRYRTRTASGLDITADGTYETDSGGLVPRKRLTGSLRAQMRYRRASLTFDIGLARETQGEVERNRSLVQLILRRDF